MIHKLQSSRSSSSKIIGLAALLIVTILLASCPAPTPPDDMNPGNDMDDPGNGMNPGDGMDPPDAPPLARGDIPLAGLRQKVVDIWSDGTTMWVLASGPGPQILAYNMRERMRDEAKDFLDLGDAVSFPTGIWSDGTTMWVTSGQNLLAYKMKEKTRDRPKDFTNATLGFDSTANLQGIWSNGTTMWVSNFSNDMIHAFHMDSKMPDTDKNINTSSGGAGGNSLQSLWGDDTTLYVLLTGTNPKRIRAYNITGADIYMLNEGKSYTSAADAGTVRGIWSDGTTMWEGRLSRNAREGRDNLWAYNLMTQVRDPNP